MDPLASEGLGKLTESKAPQLGRVEVKGLTIGFGEASERVVAVNDLTFSVSAGEFLCLLGTSGCGKSTILNAIAGFIAPTAGGIMVDGKPVEGPGPDRAMVFQRHALFPWKTVMGNVEFGLKMKGMGKKERQVLALHYISLVGLEGSERRYPAQLSGGMEQRVGLGRTLAVEPRVLLMDEPFGSLDAQTRVMMQELLLGIWEKSKCTVIFVTHDVEEAIFLADRIIVLTARPARVKKEIAVEQLRRPRSYDIVTTPEFIRIKEEALRSIREETLSAAATAASNRRK